MIKRMYFESKHDALQFAVNNLNSAAYVGLDIKAAKYYCLVSDKMIDVGSSDPEEFTDYHDAVAWSRQIGGRLYYDYERNRFQVYPRFEEI